MASFDDPTCPSCEDTSTPLLVTVNGVEDTSATLTKTTDAIPDWYLKRGVYSSLPAHFTCDVEYKVPILATSKPAGSTMTLVFDLDEATDGTFLAWWATSSSLGVDGDAADAAYGTFANRGIVKTRGTTATIDLVPPISYTSEGRTYRPHLHFVLWDSTRSHWSQADVYALHFDRNPTPPPPAATATLAAAPVQEGEEGGVDIAMWTVIIVVLIAVFTAIGVRTWKKDV